METELKNTEEFLFNFPDHQCRRYCYLLRVDDDDDDFIESFTWPTSSESSKIINGYTTSDRKKTRICITFHALHSAVSTLNDGQEIITYSKPLNTNQPLEPIITDSTASTANICHFLLYSQQLIPITDRPCRWANINTLGCHCWWGVCVCLRIDGQILLQAIDSSSQPAASQPCCCCCSYMLNLRGI